jgi:hypothetical protein
MTPEQEVLAAIQKLQADLNDHRSESAARSSETNSRIDTLYTQQVDTHQAMTNVSYIFSPDGPWKEMKEKVEKHHAVYTKGKALGGLVGLVCSWVGWDTVKNHLHWGNK